MVFNPAMPMPPGGAVTPEQWAVHIDTLTKAYQAASGFEQRKLDAEINNALKGRANAIELQRMRDKAARYGIDRDMEYKLKALEQNAQQFERQHQLDTRKFGLEEANVTGTYNGRQTEAGRQFDAEHGLNARIADVSEAQLLSSLRNEPDQMFQAMDVEQALRGIRSGRPARQYATTGALPGASTGVAAIDGATANAAGGGASSGQDPRLKAAIGVLKALPPSETEGLDPAGVAALEAAFSLYKAPLRPGTIETLSPTQQAGLKSASRMIQSSTGRSYDDFLADYEKNKPRQQSVRAA